jgi:hypothetical protein
MYDWQLILAGFFMFSAISEKTSDSEEEARSEPEREKFSIPLEPNQARSICVDWFFGDFNLD